MKKEKKQVSVILELDMRGDELKSNLKVSASFYNYLCLSHYSSSVSQICCHSHL